MKVPAQRATRGPAEAATDARPPAPVRLANPEAVLSRSDLRDLGYERRAIDVIFRGCPIIALPGYRRPLIRVSDYLRFVEQHTYRGDRVRPS